MSVIVVASLQNGNFAVCKLDNLESRLLETGVENLKWRKLNGAATKILLGLFNKSTLIFAWISNKQHGGDGRQSASDIITIERSYNGNIFALTMNHCEQK